MSDIYRLYNHCEVAGRLTANARHRKPFIFNGNHRLPDEEDGRVPKSSTLEDQRAAKKSQ
jgi:hypothetical protein